MIGAHHFQRGSRGWLLILLRWAAAILVIGVLLHFLPLAPVRAAIWKVPLWRFVTVLLVYLLAHSMGVAKWRMGVSGAGAELDFATSAQCYAGWLFGTLFLPSISGGDVVRLAVGLQRSPRPAAVLAGNVVDRFLDVAAQAGLVVLGLALLPELELFPEQLEDKVEYALLGTACAAILLLVLVYRFRKKLLGGRSRRFRRRLARFRHALRAVSQRPHVLLLGCLLGSFVQTVFLVLTAQLAIYCGLRLPLRMRLFARPRAKLVAGRAATHGGVGGRRGGGRRVCDVF